MCNSLKLNKQGYLEHKHVKNYINHQGNHKGTRDIVPPGWEP